MRVLTVVISCVVATVAFGAYARVGNDSVFPNVSTRNDRRAQPLDLTGTSLQSIESITIYHEGGSGLMQCAVYAGASEPETLLYVSEQVPTNARTGWQTVRVESLRRGLSSKMWLAWTFENNPGVRYQAGSPGRAQSSDTTFGMPDSFGPSTQANYVYSVYATGWEDDLGIPPPVAFDKVGDWMIWPYSSYSNNRRAMPFVMEEDGELQSISIYHDGGFGSMALGVYGGENAPDQLLASTALALVNPTEGWQEVPLIEPVKVYTGTRIWLAWSFDSNPGVRYMAGSPGRAQSNDTSIGLPDTFGLSGQANYRYTIFASYEDLNDPPPPPPPTCEEQLAAALAEIEELKAKMAALEAQLDECRNK